MAKIIAKGASSQAFGAKEMMNLRKLKLATVWLALLIFLCAAVQPSISSAKVHREIDTEGDPGDGNELVGGGSSGDNSQLQNTKNVPSIIEDVVEVRFVQSVVDGKLVFLFIVVSSTRLHG